MLQRKPIQRKGPGLKRSPIRKKLRTEEQKEIARITKEADERFYTEIWNKRRPYSEVSGTYLGAEVNKACIDHLLEKAKYPVYRYHEDNVLLVTIDEHAMRHAGNPLPKHKEAIDRARKQFGV